MISGILTLLAALFVIVLSILVFVGVIEGEGNISLGGAFLLITGFIVLIFSFLKFWASKLMKDPVTTLKGGVVALIVGVFGSWDLLSIIGGILGIVDSKK